MPLENRCFSRWIDFSSSFVPIFFDEMRNQNQIFERQLLYSFESFFRLFKLLKKIAERFLFRGEKRLSKEVVKEINSSDIFYQFLSRNFEILMRQTIVGRISPRVIAKVTLKRQKSRFFSAKRNRIIRYFISWKFLQILKIDFSENGWKRESGVEENRERRGRGSKVIGIGSTASFRAIHPPLSTSFLPGNLIC